MKIGVDIDGTVCDTSTSLWFSYLYQRYEPIAEKVIEMMAAGQYPYNVSELFVIPEGCDPLAFWKDPNLYEGLTPIKGSVEYLKKLSDEGNEIIFISQGKGFHFKSKYYFVKKWFPFNNGVLLTKEKYHVNVDVMIDDSIHVLNSMPKDVTTIKFRDDTIQDEVMQDRHILVEDWKGVYNVYQGLKEKI